MDFESTTTATDTNEHTDIDEVDNVEKVENSTILKEFYNQCDFFV